MKKINSMSFSFFLSLGLLFSFVNSSIAQSNITQNVSNQLRSATEVSVYASGTLVGCAGNDGSATAHASGGSGWYQFTWSNGVVVEADGQTSSTITGLAAGTYSVTVIDTDTGYSGSTSVTLEQWEPDLDISASSNDAYCGRNGSASAYASGGSTWYQFTWSNGVVQDADGQTTSTITGLAPGTYSVTVMDKDTGCSASTSVTVGNYDFDLTVDVTGTDAICGANGAVNAAVTGGSDWYEYTWSNGATGSYVGGLAPGTYSVTVLDTDTGCDGTGSVTIGDSDNLEVSATATLESCWGGDASASAVVSGGTGEYTYEWSNGGTTNTIFGLTAGEYSVTVTSGTCQASATVTVVQYFDETLMVSVSSTNALCGEGGTATAVASGGAGWYSFMWSTGLVTEESDETTSTITDLAPGTYSVTVLDTDKGCTVEASVTVGDSEPDAGVISTDDATDICIQDDNPNPITVNVEGASGSNFAWVITDADGNILALPQGPTIDLNDAGAAGVCLIWYLAYEGEITGAEVGANAADLQGCYDLSNPIEVTRTVTPTVSIEPDSPSVCSGETISFTAVATGEDLTYLWTATGGSFDDPYSTNPVFTMNAPGSYTVILEVTSGNTICSSSASTVVTIHPNPDSSFEPTDVYACAFEEVQFTANDMTTGNTYSWTATGGSFDDASSATPIWSSEVGGDYTITLEVTNAFGCATSTSTDVHVFDAIDVGIFQSAQLVCDGRPVALYATGESGLTYVWSVDAGNLSNTTGNATTFQMGMDGTYTVTLTATRLEYDDEGNEYMCMETATATITVASFSVEVTVDEIEFCGDTGSISVDCSSGDCGYVWSTGETTATISGLGAGVYSVTVADNTTNCTTEETITLTADEVNIGNYVWYDNNENCVQDSWERGVHNVHVYLYSLGDDGEYCTADDELVATDQTDNNGYYLFECQPLGAYYVKFNISFYPDYEMTCKDEGDDAHDSDAYNDPDEDNFGKTDVYNFTNTTGDNMDIDAGIHLICNNINYPGTLCGNQEICAGDIPAKIESCAPAGGGGAQPIEYLWLCTTDASQPQNLWTPVPDSNTECYQPGALYQTKYYVRCARRAGCEAYSAETEVVHVQVVQCNQTNNVLGTDAANIDQKVDANTTIELATPTQSDIAFNVYPNPVQDELTIEHKGFAADATVEVMTITGKVIRSIQIEKGTTINQQVNLKDVPTGTYFVRIIAADNTTEVVKVTKVK